MKRLLSGEKRGAAIASALILFGAVTLFVTLQKLPSVTAFIGGLLHAAAPVTAGLGLAFVLNIPVSALEKRVFSRLGANERLAGKLALITVLLLTAGLIALLCALLWPRIIESAKLLTENFRVYSEAARGLLERLVSAFRPEAEAKALTERLMSGLTQRLGEKASELLPKLPGMTFSAVTGVYRAILTLVICVHSLVNREGLIRFSKKTATALLPKKRIEGFFRGCRLTNLTFRRYVVAQLVGALVIGGASYVGMKVLGQSYPELISAFCAVGTLVPIVGPWVSIGLCTFILMASDGTSAAVRFVIMMLTIQLLEDNLVYPRIIGGAIGMTALEVLAAVIISGGLFGLPGLLIAVPAFAVARRLIRGAVDARNAARAEAGETA